MRFKSLRAPLALALLITSHIPLALHAVGTLIPAANRVDMVHDSLRNVLYISSGGEVLRYSLSSGSFLPSFTLGGNLKGMDLSPDGDTLAVADSTRSGTNCWIHLVDLVQGTSSRAFFPLAFYEGGTFTVAYGADGTVLVSSTFEGSGWVPLRRYDPQTGTTTVVGSVRQNSMLSSSGDGAFIGIEESNISSGPVHKYSVDTQQFAASSGTGWFNYEVAVNKDGTQVAAPTYGGCFIFDDAMNRIATLGAYAGGHPIGVAYHPTADAVFFAWAGTTNVDVYNSVTFQQIASLNFEYVFQHPGNYAFNNGRVRLSKDGSIVFATVGGGVRYFKHNLAVPEYRKLVIASSPPGIGQPTPVGYGTNWLPVGTFVTNVVSATVETNMVRYRSAGWVGSGSLPATGSGTKIEFFLTNHSVLTWKWEPTHYQLVSTISGQGSTSISNSWFAAGDYISVKATPSGTHKFLRWGGDVPLDSATNNPIYLTMDRGRRVLAIFAPEGGTGTYLAGEWPTFGNGPSHSGYFPGVLGAGYFSNRWSTQISANRLHQVAVGGGKVFVSRHSTLSALHESSGLPAWDYTFAPGFSINPPTYSGGSVYIQRGNHGDDTHLWSFRAADGALRWQAPHAAQWEEYMAPTVADGGVFVNGGYYGGMYGFNEADGSQRFYHALPQVSGWTPAWHEGTVYTLLGVFKAHHPITGNVLWALDTSTNAGANSHRSPVISDGVAWFTGSPNLVSVDLASRRFGVNIPGQFSGYPAAVQQMVYAISNTAVSSFTFQGDWLGNYEADTILQNQPIVTDDAVLAASSTQTYIWERYTRALRQKLPVGGRISLANNVIYVAGDDGRLHAFSAGPDIRFQVLGSPVAVGSPLPFGYGTNFLAGPMQITNEVPAQVETNLARYVSAGWTGTGSVPSSGTGTRVVVALDQHSTLTWKWAASHYQLVCRVAGPGSVNITNSWVAAGQNVSLTATPKPNNKFVRWVGDVTEAQATNPSLVVKMDTGRRITAVFASDSTLPLTGDWPTFGNGPSHAGYFPGVLANATFKPRWTSVVGGNLQQASVGNHAVYVTPWQYFGNAFLASIHEYSGKTVWWYTFASCYSINPPTYDNGSVYVQRGNHGSDTHVWSFNAQTGRTNWLAPHGAQWERYMAPVVADGGVWVNGGYYGGMYGFNASNGSQRFFNNSFSQTSGWTPAWYKGTVYSQVGYFRAHDPMNGSVLWSLDPSTNSGAGTVCPPVIAEDRAWFVGSPNLFGVDLSTRQYAVRIDGNFRGYPAVANGIVYALSNNTVRAYSTSGDYVGHYQADEELNDQPIVTDDSLIVASAARTYVFDLFTFQRKQVINLSGNLSLAHGVLYITTGDGLVHALSSTTDLHLVVASSGDLHGDTFPYLYGTNTMSQGSLIRASVMPTVPYNGSRFVPTGWKGLGSVPASGNTNVVSFTLTQDSKLTWEWAPQFYFQSMSISNGYVSVPNGWYNSNTVLAVTAVPSNYFRFVGWSGHASGTNPEIGVTMSAPRSVVAEFEPILLTNNVPAYWLVENGFSPTDEAALLDPDKDGLLNWQEFGFRTDPNKADTDLDTYNDGLEIAWNASPISATSIPMPELIIASSPTNVGSSFPLPYGTNRVALFQVVTNIAVAPPATPPWDSNVSYVVTGWSGQGSVPASGSTNTVIFTIETNSVLTWNWQPQVMLRVTQVEGGSIVPGESWHPVGQVVTLTAIPSNYFTFERWTGALTAETATASITLDVSKHVSAVFQPLLVTNGVPQWWLATNGLPVTDAGALADTDEDTLPNWREFEVGTDPHNKDTDRDTYDDALEVAWSSNPTSAVSVPRSRVSISARPELFGRPVPNGYGDAFQNLYSVFSNSVPELVDAGYGTRALADGWVGTGDIPPIGTGTSVVATLTTPHSSLTWAWRVQHRLSQGISHSGLSGNLTESQAILAAAATSNDLTGFRVATDRDLLVIGAPTARGINYPSPYNEPRGAAYIYRRGATGYHLEAKIVAPDSSQYNYFGCAVAVQSNTVVIGAYGQISASSPPNVSAYVFQPLGTNWVMKQKIATGRYSAGWDQVALAMDGPYIALGCSADPGRAANSGSVYMYRWSGASYISEGSLYVPDAKANQFFGSSVALKGNQVVVGAPGDATNRIASGAAYVFRRSSTYWMYEAKLVSGSANADFGCAVAMQTNLVVVGARFDQVNGKPSGSVYVFGYTNQAWRLQARVTPPVPESYSLFGQSLALTTNALLVGAPWGQGATSDSGAAYLYDRDGTNWALQATLAQSSASPAAEFGAGLALSDAAAIVGAPNQDGNGPSSGVAYHFDLLQPGHTFSTTWHNYSTFAQTTAVPATNVVDGQLLRFAYWTLDGVPVLTSNSPAPVRLDRIFMDRPHNAVAVYLLADADSDSDSLGDWWEYAHFGGLHFTAAGDPDADGFTNLQEYMNSTDSGSPQGILMTAEMTEPATNGPADFILSWPSSTGRSYTVLGAKGLEGPYTPVLTGVPATPPLNTLAFPATNAAAFYRVLLE